MSDVIVTRAEYDRDRLAPAVFSMLDALLCEEITPRTKVLIKPNFLMPAKPEQGVLTHPLVLRAVAEYVVRKGSRPQISDSPAAGSFSRILKTGGHRKALKGLDVTFKPLTDTVKVDIGAPFGSVDLARDILEADVVLNIPKLKTHSQMVMTLGVKNMFGAVVGLQKPEWHLRCGVHRDVFARLLVQICSVLNPAVTILDGILAMEGEGPGKSGTPRHLGLLAGSRDAFALDRVVCSMLGLSPERLPILKAAENLGIAGANVNVSGELRMVEDFRFPDLDDILVGPPFLQRQMRRYILRRPEPDRRQCKMCGDCWQYCPVNAISPDGDVLRFDYDKCIRCYCCVEVCPHGAMRTSEPLAGRLLRSAGRFRRSLQGNENQRCGGV